MTKAHSDKAALRGEPGYVWRSGQERRLGMIRQWVDLDGEILDNGCGLGNYLRAFGQFENRRFGIEVEADRIASAQAVSHGVALAVGETLPFGDNRFDFVLSNEVLEHCADDQRYMAEMVRVLKPAGRFVLFCPNRWYPVETHGIYWRGEYQFGNKPFVNYLPDPLRNRLAPHVRAYTKRGLLRLLDGLPARVIHYSRIFGGYDNIEARAPRLGKTIKQTLYAAEKTPLRVLGISHLLVVEKLG